MSARSFGQGWFRANSARNHPAVLISGASAGHGDGCFGCGTDNPIGLDLRYVSGPALTVRTSFVPATSRLHCSGAVPFGLISAILDESMATLGCLLSKTISAEHLSIDCEQVVDAHEELTIEARIDEIIADRFHTSAVVRVDGAGGVVATATGASKGASRPVRG